MNNFVISLVVALISCSAGFLAFYQSRQANKKADQIHTQKVDAEAYGRAQGIYDRALDQLQSELNYERQRRQNLELDMDKLWDYTVQTRAMLLQNGITPPPVPAMHS